MKFPDIQTLKRETLHEQYDRLHNNIIWCKREGHFHFKCFLDLQDEVLENLFKEGYEVDYIEALDSSQNDYYIISWSNV